MGKASNLLSDLLQIDVFKVGDFMLKGNHPTPFYIDLRHVISHPRIANNVVRDIYALVKDKALSVDAVCGVPYNALPFASVLSARHEIPMILKRKEAKSYGTKKLIEGVVQKGATCLILEDVVVSGASIKETADALRKEGLIVTDCITILDRLQGGKDNLLKFGIQLHSLFDIDDILSLYSSCNEVKPSVIEKVRLYLRHNVCPIDAPPPKRAPFSNRADTCRNPVLRRLYAIIERKKSNLCVSVNTLHSRELLEIASAVGPHICMLKTRINILSDFSNDLPAKLTALATEHDFLIIEDHKFSDVGSTLLQQYAHGMYNIASWADVVTVHGLPGPAILESLKKATGGKERACLLVAQMGLAGALTDSHYAQQVVQLAESDPEFVMGFVCHEKLSNDFFHVYSCMSTEDDSSGQQYSTPEDAVAAGADVVIVGKEIFASPDLASDYKNRAYGPYLDSCSKSK